LIGLSVLDSSIAVASSLIFGTIPFLDSNKENVWSFLKSIL
jgi:hypothetical protein